MEKSNYITPSGFKKLVDEQDNLLKVERPEILKVIAWAASNGDRSENADYQYGKRKLRQIEKRLRFLAKRIDDALVVDPLTITSSKVQFGATVEVENEDGESKCYSIVGVDELDPVKHFISWKSPIARALIGKEEGDEIIVNTPSGEVELEIISIQYKELET